MKKLFINNLRVGHLVKKYKNFVSNLNTEKYSYINGVITKS